MKNIKSLIYILAISTVALSSIKPSNANSYSNNQYLVSQSNINYFYNVIVTGKKLSDFEKKLNYRIYFDYLYGCPVINIIKGDSGLINNTFLPYVNNEFINKLKKEKAANRQSSKYCLELKNQRKKLLQIILSKEEKEKNKALKVRQEQEAIEINLQKDAIKTVQIAEKSIIDLKKLKAEKEAEKEAEKKAHDFQLYNPRYNVLLPFYLGTGIEDNLSSSYSGILALQLRLGSSTWYLGFGGGIGSRSFKFNFTDDLDKLHGSVDLVGKLYINKNIAINDNNFFVRLGVSSIVGTLSSSLALTNKDLMTKYNLPKNWSYTYEAYDFFLRNYYKTIHGANSYVVNSESSLQSYLFDVELGYHVTEKFRVGFYYKYAQTRLNLRINSNEISGRVKDYYHSDDASYKIYSKYYYVTDKFNNNIIGIFMELYN